MAKKELIILNEANMEIERSQMNEKAYKKSLESSLLWHIHPETGKVLPFNEKSVLLSLKREDGFFQAKIGERESTAFKELSAEEKMNFLFTLEELVGKRREEMPEGSYTTHLFQKGPGHCRKKMGEECIEVLLAREKKDIVYESADLLYHLLVFLRSVDISLEEVIAELKSRHS